MSEVKLDDIVSLCKRRGFMYQGSEIYGGLAGTWDYGPLGVQLKRNITNLWWKTFVEDRDDMYGLDAAILMNQKVWQASGHVSGFNDPLFECSNCKNRFRADHLVENWVEKHPKELAETEHPEYNQSPETLNQYKNVFNMACPTCGKNTLSDVKQFNMMFKTHVGAVEDETSVSYLRPETAQGMFVNFKNVVDSFYPDVPFGMAQIGKAFRNEIAPRDFIFRVRELEQMEIEVFIHPDGWKERFDYWLNEQKQFLLQLGLPEAKIHQVEIGPDDRAHYSKHSVDTEFDFPFGQKELLGCAYRTDYDLTKHQAASGKTMEYRPKDGGAPYIPHVIEPTFGVDRLFLATIASAYCEDEVNGEKRSYLKLPAHLAPVRVAVSPLLKNKPELVAKAREVYTTLKKEFGAVMWDDNGNIGKRYRRQDEIGTPYCVVIDFDTLEGDTAGTVTVRDRDTTEQKRVNITELVGTLSARQ
jgi:glycyl-tRNA synthetase